VRARHRHLGVRGRDVLLAGDGLADVLDCGVRGGGAARAHRADLAVGGPVAREHVPAESRRGGFDDVQRGRGGDGRVEGVAAVFEHGDARLRGQRLARGDDAALAVDGRAPRREPVEVR